MAKVLKVHDETLKNLIGKCNGKIVVKHTEDGVFAIFEENYSKEDPLKCAIEIEKNSQK